MAEVCELNLTIWFCSVSVWVGFELAHQIHSPHIGYSPHITLVFVPSDHFSTLTTSACLLNNQQKSFTAVRYFIIIQVPLTVEHKYTKSTFSLFLSTLSSHLISYYKSSSVCLFVCLSVCSLSPPRSFDRSSPNLVGVCRWTSELPLRGSFSKRSMARRVNGSLSLFTILYMHQPHATRCNGSSCLQLQSLIRHLLLDGYRTASQQCI